MRFIIDRDDKDKSSPGGGGTGDPVGIQNRLDELYSTADRRLLLLLNTTAPAVSYSW